MTRSPALAAAMVAMRRHSPLSLIEQWSASRKERRISRRTRGSPDRLVLVEEIIPKFAAAGGRILWVGCRRYTDDYPGLLESGEGECWTTDIDPDAARFGHPLRHRTGDLTRIDEVFAGLTFDAVLCNGVFGYGVDSLAQQRLAAAAIALILKPGGLLLLGWNTDKIEDPIAADVLGPPLAQGPALGLAARRPVMGTTHVYDMVLRGGSRT